MTAKTKTEAAPAGATLNPFRKTMQKPTRLLPMENVVFTFHHTPAEGVTLEDVLTRTYWANCAKQLKPGYEIKVMWADGSQWAHLVVRGASRSEALVGLIHHASFDGGAEVSEEAARFYAKWSGPSIKWAAYRTEDNGRVKENFDSREDAERWIAQHRASEAA